MSVPAAAAQPKNLTAFDLIQLLVRTLCLPKLMIMNANYVHPKLHGKTAATI